MLSLHRKKSLFVNELDLTQLFDERTFYKKFVEDVRGAERCITIESPFLTVKRAAQFSRLFKKTSSRGVKVTVNTRNPYQHDYLLRNQSFKAIKILKNSGVKVKTYKDMRHRKLAVIDNVILWEGSLNILSQSNSREVMRRTKSTELCAQMIKFAGLNRLQWW